MQNKYEDYLNNLDNLCQINKNNTHDNSIAMLTHQHTLPVSLRQHMLSVSLRQHMLPVSLRQHMLPVSRLYFCPKVITVIIYFLKTTKIFQCYKIRLYGVKLPQEKCMQL